MLQKDPTTPQKIEVFASTTITTVNALKTIPAQQTNGKRLFLQKHVYPYSNKDVLMQEAAGDY